MSSLVRAQAKRVAKRITKILSESHISARSVRIFSSPKSRCVETVQPWATPQGLEIAISPTLDEGENLLKKVKKIVALLERSRASVVVLCSHGDLIPPLLKKMTRAKIELSKGGFAVLEKGSGGFELKSLFQEPDLNQREFDSLRFEQLLETHFQI